MDRLTLSRRPTLGDRMDCLPAGDGLPIWSKIPLDAKLPIMQNPKGAVVLFTTKLGEPKHRCKQDYDFDLRDPNGKYITTEYRPLHDPHLKAHFSTPVMRRHLVRKGFISEDGKVLCSLKELNQYRQYLRHIFFLEIAEERKRELENRLRSNNRTPETEVERQVSHGTLVRRRLQQQRERDLHRLRQSISDKNIQLERRLQDIREEMTERERQLREASERRHAIVRKNQQEQTSRSVMLARRWRHEDYLRRRLIEERETQKKMAAELKCMARWNTRKDAQSAMLARETSVLYADDEERLRKIAKREESVAKQRDFLYNQLDQSKKTVREEKQRKEKLYSKLLNDRISVIERKMQAKRLGRRRRTPYSRLTSTWKLEDVLESFQVPQADKKRSFMEMLDAAIDRAVDIATDHSDVIGLAEEARRIVSDVISKVTNDIYPHYLQMLSEDERATRPQFEAEKKSSFMEMLNAVIDGAVDTVTDHSDTIGLEEEAHRIVKDVISKVKNDIYPHYLQMLAAEERSIPHQQLEASKSRSVRFSNDDSDTSQSCPLVTIHSSSDVYNEVPAQYKPVTDHVLTPCASALQMAADDDDAIPEASDIEKTAPITFVETFLLRLLDDLNSGRLSEEDIAKLASYCVDQFGSSKTAAQGEGVTSSVVECQTGETYVTTSSSSVIAAKMVDFTLDKILTQLYSGSITPDELASLTVSLIDLVTGSQSPDDMSNDSELDGYIKDTLRTATSSALDPREDSPVCDAIVDDFVLKTLSHLIQDLENDSLTKEQIKLIAKSIKDGQQDVPAKDEQSDIHNFLQNMLHQLELGTMDFQSLYQIVFAIVYTYKQIKEPQSDGFENRVTSLLRELLQTVEQQVDSGMIEDIDISIVREANNRMTNSSLDMDQIQEISTSIVNLCEVDIPVALHSAASTVETVLSQTKEKLQNNEIDNDFHHNVQNVAEAVISAISRKSPDLKDVFIQVLEKIHSFVDEEGGVGEFSTSDIDLVISQLKKNEILNDQILEIARAVVIALNHPIKSESSQEASMTVKESLREILREIQDGIIQSSCLSDVIHAIQECCNAAKSHDMHYSDFLQKLASFLRRVLDKLTYQILTGTINDTAFENLTRKSSSSFIRVDAHLPPLEKSKHVKESLTTHSKHILVSLQQLIDRIDSGDVRMDECNSIGKYLIQCGSKLTQKASYKSSSTDVVANDVVEEVIQTLQLEIESGTIKGDSLLEMTSAILSTSTSESAVNSVDTTFTRKNIQRRSQNYQASKGDSCPTLTSRSASTIASQLVSEVIDIIRRDLMQRGVPNSILPSIASSVVTLLVGSQRADAFTELDKYRPIINNIIDCLKTEKLEEKCVCEIFAVILENYKTIFADSEENTYEQKDELCEEDAVLVHTLVNETLSNIERRLAKGQLTKASLSAPSISHSGNTSLVASDLVSACLNQIRHDLTHVTVKSISPKPVADFIIDIITNLQMQLEQGLVSSLSMALFYQAVSNDRSDLHTLETNASHKLQTVVSDIKMKGQGSVYVKNIVNTYLSRNYQDVISTDPLKAIESILMSVSSDILVRFVRSTLQSILLEIQGDEMRFCEKLPSTIVLRSASSMIAESAVKEVISRVQEEMSSFVERMQPKVSKRDLERTASRLVGELKPSSPHSMGSFHSAKSCELEDIVLETLHNIVSNLRLEQSIKQSNSKITTKDSYTTQEINDFVLDVLQNIVADQQDKRSQIDLEIQAKDSFSQSRIDSNDSKDAITYVNQMLHTVLEQMYTEYRARNVSDPESGLLEVKIIETIQRSLSIDSERQLQDELHDYQRDDVRRLLIQCMSKTISYIKDGKFSIQDLAAMYVTCNRALGHECTFGTDDITEEMVVHMLEKVRIKLSTLSLNDKILDELSIQVAILGMESSLTKETRSDSSIASSQIQEIVQDVLSQITEQLKAETTHADFEKSEKDLSIASSQRKEIVQDVLSQITEQLKTATVNVNVRLSENDLSMASSQIQTIVQDVISQITEQLKTDTVKVDVEKLENELAIASSQIQTIVQGVLSQVSEQLNRDTVNIDVRRSENDLSIPSFQIQTLVNGVLGQITEQLKTDTSNVDVGNSEHDLSIASSQIQTIVQDVLSQITEQLKTDTVNVDIGGSENDLSVTSSQIQTMVEGVLSQITEQLKTDTIHVDFGKLENSLSIVSSQMQATVKVVLSQITEKFKTDISNEDIAQSEHDSTIASSQVNEIVQDVLSQITEQLKTDSSIVGQSENESSISSSQIKGMVQEVLSKITEQIKTEYTNVNVGKSENHLSIASSQIQTIVEDVLSQITEQLEKDTVNIDVGQPQNALSISSSQMQTIVHGVNSQINEHLKTDISSADVVHSEYDSSIASSQLHELVQDVLIKITEQLKRDTKNVDVGESANDLSISSSQLHEIVQDVLCKITEQLKKDTTNVDVGQSENDSSISSSQLHEIVNEVLSKLTEQLKTDTTNVDVGKSEHDSSSTSSQIKEIVQEVLIKITEQLKTETTNFDVKQSGNNSSSASSPIQESVHEDLSKKTKQLKTDTTNVDVGRSKNNVNKNDNRRRSVSSVDSQNTLSTRNSNKNEQLVNKRSADKTGIVPKIQKAETETKTSIRSTNKWLKKRCNEPRPMLSRQQSRQETSTVTGGLYSGVQCQSAAAAYGNRKQSTLNKFRTEQQALNRLKRPQNKHAIDSKTTGLQARRNDRKSAVKGISCDQITVQKSEDTTSIYLNRPLELRSLCGSHTAEIHFREPTCANENRSAFS
ncbi:uncharacterized protein LOC127838469 isoform X2 [Dreissena polymorpha]|uniref:uncharacterized protein LOC127838469 isoform X2 n=1 Tax=Dreissena polymorpha TaxID=45954 RepID=UPI0022651B9D|nr:uncharacterized protein LOC127838469 isoform X2 [Dreissena polymorpha]